MDYTTLTIEERSAKALQLADAIIQGRQRELARMGRDSKDEIWWANSQAEEDRKIAELQLVCEGLDGDINQFAIVKKSCIPYTSRPLHWTHSGYVIFGNSRVWVYRCKRTGKAFWDDFGFARNIPRETYLEWLQKQKDQIREHNRVMRNQKTHHIREAEFFAKQKELRKTKAKRLSNKQYCEEIGKTVSIFLNTDWKDDLKFEVDGSQVCINRSQAQAWEKWFPKTPVDVVCIPSIGD